MDHRHSKCFSAIDIADLPLVGRKNASVGAMHRELTLKCIEVSNGFAVAAETCRRVLGQAQAWPLALHDACQRCFGSLFTERTIHHRIVHGFKHLKVALSADIKKIMRSDLAASDVMFALDTESVLRAVVFIPVSLSSAALLPATLHMLQVGRRLGRKPRAPR